MRELLKNKKSAEMTIGTIIIIILALVVLIFLIYSFMTGGGSLMDTLRNFAGGGPNVDTIKNACQAACTTQSANAYCSEVRTLKVTAKSSYLGSCSTFSTLGVAGLSAGTIAGCSEINCKDQLPQKCGVGDLKDASWHKQACTGTGAQDFTSQVGDSGTNDIKLNPYCCIEGSTEAAKKCSEQPGAVNNKAIGCPAGKCPAGKEITGTDIIAPQVCCSVACTQ